MNDDPTWSCYRLSHLQCNCKCSGNGNAWVVSRERYHGPASRDWLPNHIRSSRCYLMAALKSGHGETQPVALRHSWDHDFGPRIHWSIINISSDLINIFRCDTIILGSLLSSLPVANFIKHYFYSQISNLKILIAEIVSTFWLLFFRYNYRSQIYCKCNHLQM